LHSIFIQNEQSKLKTKRKRVCESILKKERSITDQIPVIPSLPVSISQIQIADDYTAYNLNYPQPKPFALPAPIDIIGINTIP